MNIKPLFIRIGYFLLFSVVLFSHVAKAEPVELTSSLKDQLSQLPSLVDQPLERSTLDGKPVVVTFFASWCPPCREEFKQLNQLVQEIDTSQLTVVAINVFEDWFGVDQERLNLFLEKYSPRFHVVEGNDEIKQAFDNVSRIPTLFVFDSNGIATDRFIHETGASKKHLDAQELKTMIQNL